MIYGQIKVQNVTFQGVYYSELKIVISGLKPSLAFHITDNGVFLGRYQLHNLPAGIIWQYVHAWIAANC